MRIDVNNVNLDLNDHLIQCITNFQHICSLTGAGICTASIALFTELDIVLEMISIGTLLVFYMVANALVYRGYVKLSRDRPLPTLIYLLLLTSTSIGFSLSWKLEESYWWGLPLFGGAVIAITAFFQHRVPCHRRPSEWSVPLMPWPAAASVFLNVFLMTTLKERSFVRFGVWSSVITLFYLLYGVHSTHLAEETEMELSAEMEERHGNLSQSVHQNKIEVHVH